MKNNTIVYKFNFVKSSNGDVTLYDTDRHIYIRITNHKLFFGFTEAEVNIFAINGDWILFETSKYFFLSKFKISCFKLYSKFD